MYNLRSGILFYFIFWWMGEEEKGTPDMFTSQVTCSFAAYLSTAMLSYVRLQMRTNQILTGDSSGQLEVQKQQSAKNIFTFQAREIEI